MQLSLISLALTRIYGGAAGFSPLSLFAAGEQGAWYDPSDFSTMFQDSTGTTPVTAVGQSVGLILDKSKGLVLGSQLVSDSSFDSPAAWTPQDARWSVSGGKATYTPGSLSYLQSTTNTTVAGGKWYEFSLTIADGTPGTNMAWFAVFNSASNYNYLGVYRDVNTNGVVKYIVYVESDKTGFKIYGNNSSTSSWSVTDFSVKELAGNHATQATSASRPVLRQDANSKYYLEFDGVDDSLATAAINFTATDKMSVFAGVHKNNDTAAQILCELPSTPGAVYIAAPDSAANYSFLLTGTAASGYNATTFTAPITNVISCNFDIAGADRAAEIKPRINGAIPTLTGIAGPSAGTGNFNTNALSIGSRGSSLRFNGRIYALIVRGALSTTQEITDTETWVAGKTGVTL